MNDGTKAIIVDDTAIEDAVLVLAKMLSGRDCTLEHDPAHEQSWWVTGAPCRFVSLRSLLLWLARELAERGPAESEAP